MEICNRSRFLLHAAIYVEFGDSTREQNLWSRRKDERDSSFEHGVRRPTFSVMDIRSLWRYLGINIKRDLSGFGRPLVKSSIIIYFVRFIILFRNIFKWMTFTSVLLA